MINKNTGEITLFSPNFILSSSLKKKDLISLLPYAKARPQSGSHQSFSVGKCLLGGKEFQVQAFFFDEDLWSVHLEQVSKNDDPWKDWSEDQAEKEKLENDSILQTLLGNPPYRYSWGVVTSEFDRRGGACTIVINYKKAYDIFPNLK